MSSNLSLQDKSNLARIRENQRRSRARRKEYLQELEGRWRRCEQAGAQASSEIQAAARRVADENKRLRALLRERGVRDDEVTEYLVRSGEGSQAREGAPPVALLETLLSSRKDCGNKCGDILDENQKSTSWRPLWTEVSAQPPEVDLDVAQPVPQPSCCLPASGGCQTVKSPQPQPQPHVAEVLDHGYPPTQQNVALQEFSPTYTSSNDPYVHAFSASGPASYLLTTNTMVPQLDCNAVGSAPVAVSIGCSSGGECKVINGHIFGMMDPIR